MRGKTISFVDPGNISDKEEFCKYQICSNNPRHFCVVTPPYTHRHKYNWKVYSFMATQKLTPKKNQDPSFRSLHRDNVGSVVKGDLGRKSLELSDAQSQGDFGKTAGASLSGNYIKMTSRPLQSGLPLIQPHGSLSRNSS